MQISVKPASAKLNKLSEDDIKKLPKVDSEYQSWYSESLALITQLLPDRVEDFKAYYTPRTTRKSLDASNYTMTDYLRGLQVGSGSYVRVDQSSGLTPMYQQALIVQGLKDRFVSTLFDIKTLVQADMFDDEILVAQELITKGFQRGAGAICGVVLEGHLLAVCERHKIVLRKKNPSISDLNDVLKNASVIEVATWRFVQHLGDLRNKCDHKKDTEPTKEEIIELANGVSKITKTVF